MFENYFIVYNLAMLKSKPSFLFRQKRGGDVGFPSVCCECHWLIKKPNAAPNRARQELQAETKEKNRQNQREAI